MNRLDRVLQAAWDRPTQVRRTLGRIATVDALNIELTAWTDEVDADERQLDW